MEEKAKTIKATGSFLCGKVNMHANTMSTNASICHCSMCTQWSAGPFFAVHCGKDVIFSGEEYIVRYDSSDWGQRAFCSNCGTHLFYYLKPAGEYMACAEIFSESDKLTLTQQIFIEEKPEYYSFANDTVNLTGKEVFDSFINAQEDN